MPISSTRLRVTTKRRIAEMMMLGRGDEDEARPRRGSLMYSALPWPKSWL
jgi:hypothetical protein